MSEIPVKNVTVSIILTESTASLLNLDIPHLEEIAADNSNHNVCCIRAIENKNEIQQKSPELKKRKSLRSTLWNSVSDYPETDSDLTYPEVAYLSRNLNNSSSSIDIIDGTFQLKRFFVPFILKETSRFVCFERELSVEEEQR